MIADLKVFMNDRMTACEYIECCECVCAHVFEQVCVHGCVCAHVHEQVCVHGCVCACARASCV